MDVLSKNHNSSLINISFYIILLMCCMILYLCVCNCHVDDMIFISYIAINIIKHRVVTA
jgi:hypothetical protein